MYRINLKNPLKDIKFLYEHNRSRLSYLEVWYMVGNCKMDEWMKFRELAIKGELK